MDDHADTVGAHQDMGPGPDVDVGAWGVHLGARGADVHLGGAVVDTHP
ncbi:MULTISPECIES: hypothetical protein [unclassified Nocardiopsis]|nr:MULTISPECIES: hypothetical protein [unclassified Nocardiopsis]MBQ1081158.1 hypothetical protein [Nocardiopsis sp. B62]